MQQAMTFSNMLNNSQEGEGVVTQTSIVNISAQED